jgi:agmatine deiminase
MKQPGFRWPVRLLTAIICPAMILCTWASLVPVVHSAQQNSSAGGRSSYDPSGYMVGRSYPRATFGTTAATPGSRRAETAESTAEGYLDIPSGVRINRIENGRGYQLRGEFERQNAILVSSRAIISAESIRNAIEKIYRKLTIVVIYENEGEVLDVIYALNRHKVSHRFLRFLPAANDSIWVRDFGPVVMDSKNDGSVAILDTQYASAGRQHDDQMPMVVAGTGSYPMLESRLWIDGGNILVNGEDLLVTTRAMLSNNRERRESEVVDDLKETYGVSQVLFLETLRGEPTGHIDMFATFTDKFTVIVGQYDPEVDAENAAVLNRNADALANVVVNGHRLTVKRVPMPANADGIWRTYLNVVYANGTVLIPSYSKDTERDLKEVIHVFRKSLPGWSVETVASDDLIAQDGAIHCAMMNLGGISADKIGHRVQNVESAFIESDSRMRDKSDH